MSRPVESSRVEIPLFCHEWTVVFVVGCGAERQRSWALEGLLGCGGGSRVPRCTSIGRDLEVRDGCCLRDRGKQQAPEENDPQQLRQFDRELLYESHQDLLVVVTGICLSKCPNFVPV